MRKLLLAVAVALFVTSCIDERDDKTLTPNNHEKTKTAHRDGDGDNEGDPKDVTPPKR